MGSRPDRSHASRVDWGTFIFSASKREPGAGAIVAIPIALCALLTFFAWFWDELRVPPGMRTLLSLVLFILGEGAGPGAARFAWMLLGFT